MAIKRAEPKTTPTTAPPPAGHNSGADPQDIEAFRQRYGELAAAGKDWLDFKITTQSEADDLEAYRKQVRAFTRDATAARKAVLDPLNEAIKEARATWDRVLDAGGKLIQATEPALRAFLEAKEAELRAKREKAQAEAKAAAEAAERAAQAADPHSLESVDAIAEAEAAAAKAARQAAELERAKPKAGSQVTVDGVRRSASLRTYTVLAVSDRKAALAFLVKKGFGPLLDEAILKAARAYRKDNDNADIPGIDAEEQRRAS